MSDSTKIEWAEATWSPVTGCTRVSEGCRHCYIERTPPFRMDHRKFSGPDIGATTGVKMHSERLHIPLKWRKPKRIFVCSLADLFQDEVPDEFIAEVFAVMALAPWHTFQVLTKRHGRMRSLLGSDDFRQAVARAAVSRAETAPGPPYLPEHLVIPGPGQSWWPLPNVWAGVSVEDQKWADIRIPALRESPAAVRFLSAEPLLGPLDGLDLTGIGWTICGGESGPSARPMQPDWARSLRDQCTAASVPFFMKQWGEWCHSEQMPEDTWSWLDSRINLGQEQHPEPHRVGKKRAGRLLDGRTWDQYPEES